MVICIYINGKCLETASVSAQTGCSVSIAVSVLAHAGRHRDNNTVSVDWHACAGLLSGVWYLLWLVVARHSVSQHPCISRDEKQHILRSLTHS